MKFMGTDKQVQVVSMIKPENKLSDEPWWTRYFKHTAVAIVTSNQDADQ
jgi:hypothetical protein